MFYSSNKAYFMRTKIDKYFMVFSTNQENMTLALIKFYKQNFHISTV